MEREEKNTRKLTDDEQAQKSMQFSLADCKYLLGAKNDQRKDLGVGITTLGHKSLNGYRYFRFNEHFSKDLDWAEA